MNRLRRNLPRWLEPCTSSQAPAIRRFKVCYEKLKIKFPFIHYSIDYYTLVIIIDNDIVNRYYLNLVIWLRIIFIVNRQIDISTLQMHFIVDLYMLYMYTIVNDMLQQVYHLYNLHFCEKKFKRPSSRARCARRTTRRRRWWWRSSSIVDRWEWSWDRRPSRGDVLNEEKKKLACQLCCEIFWLEKKEVLKCVSFFLHPDRPFF